MTRTTVLGFAITIGILVPAGWHWPDANIQTDGKRLRPMQQTFELDGVKVALDVDRSVITTGDTVKATLRAFGPAREVAVDVRALHSTNYSGERVERPWTVIDRETIKLVSAPGGGKPVSTAIVMGKRPKGLGLEDSFRIVVTGHGTKAPVREYDVGGDARDFSALENDGQAAGIAVRGWSGDSLGIKISAAGPITATAPFKVTVKIKNSTGRTLDHAPWVSLGTEEALMAKPHGEGEAEDEAEDAEPLLTIERVDHESTEVKPGEVTTEEFIVTPHGKLPRKITFLANAAENDGLGPYGSGALDAVTFAVTEPKPGQPSVAKK